MTEIDQMLVRGERARLFPVLADTSKEGRTLSIFLACLAYVDEFSRALFSDIGQRVGKRTKVETYTEVVLQKGGEKAHRPDGLIVLRSGSTTWTALVEAKVGNSELTAEQLECYLELAKLNGVDTLITLSNQFATLPTHHPVALSAQSRRKAQIFHWSWMYILTQASLLLSNEQIADRDQSVILNEMVRFLTHASTGVKSFDQMPAAWPEIVSRVQTGGTVSANADDAKDVVGAWHQELKDLTLILSRQLGTEVSAQISRAHATDPGARLKADLANLAGEKCLSATLKVPDAAAPIDICADLQTRAVTIAMRLRAPDDRKSTKARVNWLLRQIPAAENPSIHIRLLWPGRAAHTQHQINALRENAELASAERSNLVVSSFQVLLVRNLGARFGQRKNFISDLEAALPEFYEQVGQHLRAWQPPAPKLAEDKSEPGGVSTEAMQQTAERSAMEQGG